MFLGTIGVLDRLVAIPEQAVHISRMTASVKQMEAVAQILLRRVDTESKYLARLEGMSFQLCKSHVFIAVQRNEQAPSMTFCGHATIKL